MRAIWKGVVSFGLVTIPIKLFTATEQHDVSLRQVHATDGGRVRYRRVCEAEDKEIPYGEVAKGYELPDGQVVVLDDADLESLPIASSRTIEVQRFVPAEQVDGIYLAKSYYLQADDPGVKPYVLLREALARAGTVALVKVALRQREALALLRPFGNVLLLQTMLWPDEVRDAEQLAPPEDVGTRPQELAMAASYIETLTGDFDPGEFSDDYVEALRKVVEAKIAGQDVVRPKEPGGGRGEVIDLMAALEASVAEAKRSRGEPAKKTGSGRTARTAGETTTGSTAKKPRAAATRAKAAEKKSTAKPTAKQPAAKKAAEKKEPAKKPTSRRSA